MTLFDRKAVVWLLVFICGCGGSPPKGEPVASAPKDQDSIARFCADCHALPKPERFAKEHWKREVEQGFRIYQTSGRRDLTPPDLEATIAFFRDAAPNQTTITIPDRIQNDRFVLREIPWPKDHHVVSTSSIRWTSKPNDEPECLLTDMWTGEVTRVEKNGDGLRLTTLADLAHPSHVEPIDLDADGLLDYLVSDLGSLNPQSEHQGSLWLLRGLPNGELRRQPLRLGFTRVADARPMDYDNDGDLDLIVADFGLHFVGSIHLGENKGLVNEMPIIHWSVLDPRPGAISLPTVDFNNDGRLDFISLTTQHYETIDLRINLGDGNFETHNIFGANDPSYGSSSLQIVDFDYDGDWDLLYTNGDTFDDTLAKSIHGIHWLENEGTFPFKVHRIAEMPGCYRAVAGDIDGDGDMDVASVALLTTTEVAKYPPNTFDGVAWFEQQSGGNFIRHSLQTNVCQAATCSLFDWDNDGDLDLIVPPCDTQHGPSSGLLWFENRSENPKQESLTSMEFSGETSQDESK